MTLFIICLSSDPKGIVALLYFLGYSLALCVSSLFPVAFIPKNDLIDCCDSACWVQWLVIEHSSMDGCAKSSYYWGNTTMIQTLKDLWKPQIFLGLLCSQIFLGLFCSQIFLGLLCSGKQRLQLHRFFFRRMLRVSRRKQGHQVQRRRNYILFLNQVHVADLAECIFQCDLFFDFQGEPEIMLKSYKELMFNHDSKA